MSRALLVFAVGLIAGSASAGENVWTSSGPPGHVLTLIVDPITGTLHAGVRVAAEQTIEFRSLDHGASWTWIAAAPLDTSISAAAISPERPATVYASTNYRAWGVGVYRSDDGGLTWLSTAFLPNSLFRTLTVQPGAGYTLYAGGSSCYCTRIPCYTSVCNAAVLASRDSGSTWTEMSEGLSGFTVFSLAFDTTEPNRIHAGGFIGLFSSIDGGVHWSLRAQGLEDCPTILALAVRPTDGALFAGTGRLESVGSGFACGGVFRSSDRGETWAATVLPQYYVTALAIDPARPDTIYAGTARNGAFSPDAGVFRSEDGGETWAAFGSIPGSPDVLQIVVEPSGRFVHAGTSAGVFDYEIVPGARPPVVPPRQRETRSIPPRP